MTRETETLTIFLVGYYDSAYEKRDVIRWAKQLWGHWWRDQQDWWYRHD